jgi:hypothetical protein
MINKAKASGIFSLIIIAISILLVGYALVSQF